MDYDGYNEPFEVWVWFFMAAIGGVATAWERHSDRANRHVTSPWMRLALLAWGAIIVSLPWVGAVAAATNTLLLIGSYKASQIIAEPWFYMRSQRRASLRMAEEWRDKGA